MRTPLSVRTAQNIRQAMQLRRNVGTKERWLSLAGGGAAVAGGVRRGGAGGTALAALGSYLLFRGMTGHCLLYARLHVSTTRPGETGLWGQNLVHVRTKVTVQRPREMVYRYWRNLENLPTFMRHIREVRVDGNRSHWVARTPLGLRLQWNSQIIQDTPNERLVWRSIAGSDVDTRGEVRFRPTIDGGTEVDVDMYYRPPGGAITRTLAKLLGGISEKMVRGDIERLKETLESQASTPRREMRNRTGEVYDQGLGAEPVTPAHG
jgi:uncharacterized membrane protein